MLNALWSQHLCVSDRLLEARTKFLARVYGEDCKASSGFLAAFKKRHSIVSRRETSSRILPDDAKEQATGFLREFAKIVVEKGIQPQDILNFDQVPRYFTREPKQSLESRGTKDVKILKGKSL